jgi:hypothetical protein
MKKLWFAGLAMFMVVAFSAVATGSASAEVALWLNNGNDILVNEASETEGTLTLIIDGLFTATVECSGIFDGTVGPTGFDEVTSVLNLAKEALGTALVGLSVNCEVLAGNSCGAAKTLAQLWGVNLPWASQLELTSTGVLDTLGNAGKRAAYEILCENGLSNLCEGNPDVILTNNATGKDVDNAIVNQKPAEDVCEIGEGLIESPAGASLTKLVSGATLTVSDP